MNKKASLNNKKLYIIISICVLVLILLFLIFSNIIPTIGNAKTSIDSSKLQESQKTEVTSALDNKTSINIDSLPPEVLKENPNLANYNPLNPSQRELTVDEINQRNKENGFNWQAKENNFSKMTLEEKKKVLGINFTDKEKEEANNRIKELQEKINKGEHNTTESDTKSEKNYSKSMGDIEEAPGLNPHISEYLTKSMGDIEEAPGHPDITTNYSISFDWRNVNSQNYITEVKDQGNCGSCWAFATLGALEGQYNTYFNNPQINLNLSEQQLISDFNPDGCNGLYTDEFSGLFNYISSTGEYTESYWPYIACDAQGNPSCQYYNSVVPGESNTTFKTSEFESIPLGDIGVIKEALVTKGPVIAGMLVYYDFFNYSSGVYQADISTGVAGGHAILIVGYGNYDGIDYWIVKNSWGTEWGEEGYFKIKIGDASGLENNFLYVLKTPILDGTQPSCIDQDQDNYNYWGTYSVEYPDNCPESSSEIKDCDDSNPNNTLNCNSASTLGRLNVTSTPDNSKVFIKDQISNEWAYRGRTPITFSLNSGQREIKIEKIGYFPQEETININSGEISNLSISLEHDSENFPEGWPVNIGREIYSSIVYEDIDNDGELEFVFGASKELDNPNYGNCAIYAVNRDGTIVNGFPVTVTCSVSYSYGGYNDWTPVITDIDNDGQKEIIAITYNGGSATIYNVSGSGQINWEKLVSEDDDIVDSAHYNGPMIEDIDGDNQKEIIFNSYKKLYVFDRFGNAKPGWPSPESLENETVLLHGIPAIVDFNSNDNQKEIAIAISFEDGTGQANKYSKAVVFNPNGTIVSGYPITLNYLPQYWRSPAVTAGDIDKDNNQEIIVSDINKIYIINGSGNIKQEFCQPTDNYYPTYLMYISNLNNINILTSNFSWVRCLIYTNSGELIQSIETENRFLSIGDIDNDKESDIVSNFFEELFSYNQQGNTISGYPKNGTQAFNAPLIIDMDNDGKTEVLSSSLDGYVYAFKTNSDYDPRYMDWPMYAHDPQHTNNYNMPYCSDGTWNMKFSTVTPGKYCAWGQLVDNCQESGCSADFICADNGSCIVPEIIR
jgi:C1A family cysteine protease